MDLLALTADDFRPLVGRDFEVLDAGVPCALRLDEVRPLPAQPNAPRSEPFTLEFSGPPQPMLPQRIYRMRNADLGELDLFLVPIGYDESGGLRYEAVFN